MSSNHTSRIILPLLRWLFPELSDEAVHGVVFAVRKCAHLGEYAILALLSWRAFRGTTSRLVVSTNFPPQLIPWRWSEASWTILLVALYAASDEFHQSFVPSREASVVDVLIDTSGAVLALIFLWSIGRWRKRW